MANRKPALPKDAGASGKALWRSVVDVWELDEHEIALLREAVRTVDQLDQLAAIVKRQGLIVDGGKAGPKAHPALVEARQLRIALARIFAALRLPDGEEGGESQGRRQRRVGVRGVYAPGGVT
jgi:hypothetical protein